MGGCNIQLGDYSQYFIAHYVTLYGNRETRSICGDHLTVYTNIESLCHDLKLI